MLKRLRNNRGSGYIDVVVIILSVMMVIALAVSVFPVYVAKSQLDTFAQELCREAEICGRIGSETAAREIVLQERMGITPAVTERERVDKVNAADSMIFSTEKQLSSFSTPRLQSSRCIFPGRHAARLLCR